MEDSLLASLLKPADDSALLQSVKALSNLMDDAYGQGALDLAAQLRRAGAVAPGASPPAGTAPTPVSPEHSPGPRHAAGRFTNYRLQPIRLSVLARPRFLRAALFARPASGGDRRPPRCEGRPGVVGRGRAACSRRRRCVASPLLLAPNA